jgi:SAM-dependent methyltransferase
MPSGDPLSNKLTDQAYWDSVWQREPAAADRSPSLLAGIKGMLTEYNDDVLWNELYPRLLPRSTEMKALEVGSAPGHLLLRFHESFGYIPYGVEYSDTGAELNRETFKGHGLDPDNVIHADFFASEFQDHYRASFDVVLSHGFIEHFRDVRDVVRRHVELLKPGGYLVITIPRFRGIYYPWMRLFQAEDLARHNLDIMKRDQFAAAFEDQGLSPRFCGYYGSIALKRFVFDSSTRLARELEKLLVRTQKLTDVFYRFVVTSPGVQSELFSPYLIYVGTRG